MNLALLSVISQGFLDSISLHWALKYLAKPKILQLCLKVFLANILLLVGSTYLYNGILKGSEYLVQITQSESSLFNVHSALMSDVLWLLFHGLWLIPIYVMCYLASTAWYQEIGDEIVREKKGTPLKNAVATGTYAFIAWLMIFLQYMILNLVVPLMCDKLLLMSQYLHTFVGRSLELSLTLIKHISISIAIILQCVLYGWYGFDPHWIAERVTPDDRFLLIQNHWAYFVGFGMPYVIIIRTTDFFVGYGIYLGLFPFCIMLACTAIQEKAYKKAYPKNHQITDIDFFYYSKLLSQLVITTLFKPSTRDSRKEK